MRYAIIGFGGVGHALARMFARKNIDVAVAGRRPPEAFASQAKAIGLTVIAASLQDALGITADMSPNPRALKGGNLRWHMPRKARFLARFYLGCEAVHRCSSVTPPRQPNATRATERSRRQTTDDLGSAFEVAARLNLERAV